MFPHCRLLDHRLGGVLSFLPDHAAIVHGLLLSVIWCWGGIGLYSAYGCWLEVVAELEGAPPKQHNPAQQHMILLYIGLSKWWHLNWFRCWWLHLLASWQQDRQSLQLESSQREVPR